ncbi:hypothetical protein JHK87_054238 [Glycine soja]|nr:hypothetical protein JHK87_054238 [Glycine soja]
MNTHKTPLDDKTRKIRHLLVSFYSPIPLASSNPFSKHTSSDDINSTSFQHDQFMNNLITVQSRSDSVNPSPCKNREHIEKMYQTCNLLFKIQFIYDLPDKLGMCIKSEDYANAVKFYTGAMPIFKLDTSPLLDSYILPYLEEPSLESALDASVKVVFHGARNVLLDINKILDDNLEILEKLRELIIDWIQQGYQDFFRELEELASSFSRRSVLGNEVKQVLPQDMRKHHRVDSSESTASSRSNSFGDEKLSRSNNIQKGRNQQLLETRLAKLFKQKS